jgi:hypothetical protein
MFKKLINFLSSPLSLVITNAILIGAAVLTNAYYQAFCRPTLWATIILFICFVNTIFYPLLSRWRNLLYISNFISGISFGIFIYCIIFLEHINILGLFAILIVVGLTTFIPHFFAIQLFYKLLISSNNKITKVLFSLGVLTFLTTSIFFGIQYRQAIKSIDLFKKSKFTSLDKTFMTEKILGMYFKYHTQICEFDGWRPPLHDPALVIGQWFNGRLDPMSLDNKTRFDLRQRILLYKKFFPDKKVKYECSCAIEYSSAYHKDELFKTP